MDLCTPTDIGLALRDGRRRLGLSQAQLAESLGKTQAWISEVEAGKGTARLGLVLEALSAVGVRLSTGLAGKPIASPIDDGVPDVRDIRTPPVHRKGHMP